MISLANYLREFAQSVLTARDEVYSNNCDMDKCENLMELAIDETIHDYLGKVDYLGTVNKGYYFTDFSNESTKRRH